MIPESNRAYWEQKLRGNVARDRRVCEELRQRDFVVVIVWECETKNIERLEQALRKQIGSR